VRIGLQKNETFIYIFPSPLQKINNIHVLNIGQRYGLFTNMGKQLWWHLKICKNFDSSIFINYSEGSSSRFNFFKYKSQPCNITNENKLPSVSYVKKTFHLQL